MWKNIREICFEIGILMGLLSENPELTSPKILEDFLSLSFNHKPF